MTTVREKPTQMFAFRHKPSKQLLRGSILRNLLINSRQHAYIFLRREPYEQALRYKIFMDVSNDLFVAVI